VGSESLLVSAVSSGDAAQDLRGGVEKCEQDLRLAPHHHSKRQGQSWQALPPATKRLTAGEQSLLSFFLSPGRADDRPRLSTAWTADIHPTHLLHQGAVGRPTLKSRNRTEPTAIVIFRFKMLVITQVHGCSDATYQTADDE